MQQTRKHAFQTVRAALASTALVQNFAVQFHSEKQIDELAFRLERVVVAGHTALEAAYIDLLAMVVPILAQHRNVFADATMYVEIHEALYPNVLLMRRFNTAEDVQIAYQALQHDIIALAKTDLPHVD